MATCNTCAATYQQRKTSHNCNVRSFTTLWMYKRIALKSLVINKAVKLNMGYSLTHYGLHLKTQYICRDLAKASRRDATLLL